MSTISLFRKWRSQTFEDLVGQKAVVQTLRNALQSGSPARAYLFCGPRGTGKTSTARIFAKALNCEAGPTPDPCGSCSPCRRIAEGSCMDVLEIDAASHTQVDKIREFIVDKVHFAPAEARFKVYIIDEVHKLSTSSFNALLKTLEEPPPHVVFILATTHPHELLPTILSRCQRHDFLRLSPGEIREQLQRVASAEGIQLEPGAGDLLSRSAEGSLRDALVQLEQAATFAGSQVGEDDVRTLLGLAGSEAMARLVGAVVGQDAREALQLLDELVQSGRDLGRLATELVDYLRRLLLVSVRAADAEMLGASEHEWADLQARVAGLPPARLMAWLKAAMEMQGEARDPARGRLLWEMTLIRLTVPQVSDDVESLVRRVESLEQALRSGAGLPGAAPSQSAAPAAVVEKTAPPVSAPGRPAPPAAPPAPAREPVPVREPEAPPTPSSGDAGAPEQPRTGDSPGSGAASRAPDSSSPPGTPRGRGAQEGATPAGGRPSPDLGWDSVPSGSAGRPSREEAAPPPSAPPPPEPPPSPAAPREEAAPEAARSASGKPVDAKAFWQAFLAAVCEHDKRLKAVLFDARLEEVAPGRLHLAFPGKYQWHRDMAMGQRDLLERCAGEILGHEVTLECSLDGGKAAPSEKEEHKTLVRRAEHLFSGRVVEGPEG